MKRKSSSEPNADLPCGSSIHSARLSINCISVCFLACALCRADFVIGTEFRVSECDWWWSVAAGLSARGNFLTHSFFLCLTSIWVQLASSGLSVSSRFVPLWLTSMVHFLLHHEIIDCLLLLSVFASARWDLFALPCITKFGIRLFRWTVLWGEWVLRLFVLLSLRRILLRDSLEFWPQFLTVSWVSVQRTNFQFFRISARDEQSLVLNGALGRMSCGSFVDTRADSFLWCWFAVRLVFFSDCESCFLSSQQFGFTMFYSFPREEPSNEFVSQKLTTRTVRLVLRTFTFGRTVFVRI